jgi:hypothetical protein
MLHHTNVASSLPFRREGGRERKREIERWRKREREGKGKRIEILKV